MRMSALPDPRFMSSWPSGRSPLPASRIRSRPLGLVTLTQDVLPPYRAVRGPGVGIDPRVPQNRTADELSELT
jgi:hypothetical protein